MLTASIPSSLIAAPGTATITVSNPSGGSSKSAAQSDRVTSSRNRRSDPGDYNCARWIVRQCRQFGDSLNQFRWKVCRVPICCHEYSSRGKPVASSAAIRDTCLGSAPPGCVPTTTRVSVTYDGSLTNGHSRDSAISADGRSVAFDSSATNILPNSSICAPDAGYSCTFLRDTCAGADLGCTPTTVAISIDTQGAVAPGGEPAITPDGRFVAFASGAANLVPGDTNGVVDVFVRDTCLGAPPDCTLATTFVSLSSVGSQGNQNSESDALSARAAHRV